MDERGVSSTLSYVMSLAIAAILVTGLLLAGGTFVDDRRDEVVRNELHVIGQQVSADVERTDRLVRAGEGSTEAAIIREFPDSVAGVNYRLEVRTGSTDQIALIAPRRNLEVTVSVETKTPLAESTAQGGAIEAAYDGSSNSLVIDDA